nr:uncharacterized protein LOC109157601 [Ipomoea batatas]
MSKAPFVELGISRNLDEEVYLAAFLACWLCTFVVSGKPTATIRLETFKMACKMTKGIKVQNSDSSGSLDQVVASQQSSPPSNPYHEKARPEPSQVSFLPGVESFMSKYMVFSTGLWNDICEKLRETLAESSNEFFKKAEDYDKIWSQLSEPMPVEAQVTELCLAQGVLKDAQQKLSETQTLLSEQQKILKDSDGQVTLLEKAIKEADNTIKDSREKLTKIHDDRPKLQYLVTKAQEHHKTSREVVISAEEEVKRIQETPMLTDEDEEKLSLIKKDLEVDKEDLMNFEIM